MCKQNRVQKNRKAGASQSSSKLAAWQLLGSVRNFFFFKNSRNMKKVDEQVKKEEQEI